MYLSMYGCMTMYGRVWHGMAGRVGYCNGVVVCIYACMNAQMHESMYAFVYVLFYACMRSRNEHVCMYCL